METSCAMMNRLLHNRRQVVGACWSCVNYRPEGCIIGRQGWPDIGRRCKATNDCTQGYEYEPGSDEAEARYKMSGRDD